MIKLSYRREKSGMDMPGLRPPARASGRSGQSRGTGSGRIGETRKFSISSCGGSDESARLPRARLDHRIAGPSRAVDGGRWGGGLGWRRRCGGSAEAAAPGRGRSESVRPGCLVRVLSSDSFCFFVLPGRVTSPMWHAGWASSCRPLPVCPAQARLQVHAASEGGGLCATRH